MKKNLRKRILVLLVCWFGICGVSNVFAEDEGSDEFTLEEVTVTAQKREENQQKVPIAMEIISGEDIKELGMSDIDEILYSIPGAFVNKTSDGLRVSLRSISNDAPNVSDLSPSIPTVSVNTDGIFSTRKNTGQGLYDIERVEVLFGPQSTLYASNSPGGIVNIITANPKTGAYEASGSLEYGNFDLLHTEGSMNAPINSTMALRAAFTTTIRDGYLSNGTDDEDSKSARLRALYQPSETLSFLITGELSRTGGKGYSGVTAFEDQDEVEDPWATDQSVGSDKSRLQKKLYGNFEWDFGFATATLVPSYSTQDFDSSNAVVQAATGTTVTWENSSSDEEKGVELRFASSADSSIKWILGLNYYSAHGESNQLADTGASREMINDTTTHAIFGNITYPLTGVFRINAGVRQSRATNDVENNEIRISTAGVASSVTEVVNRKHSTPNYRFGVEYDISDNSMLYADWSSSFRLLAMAKNQDDPEELTAYTLGSKNRFFENRLQLNLSTYYYNYDEYHAIHGRVVAPDTGLPDNGTQTAGDAIVYGADLSATTVISSQDILNLSVSYLKSEFTDLFFDYESEYLEDEDWTGKEMSFSPNWTISANYSHSFDLPNGSTLTTRLDTRYQSSFIISIIESVAGTDYTGYRYQEPHHIDNFSAVYNSSDRKWNLTAYVKNIWNYAEKRSLIQQTMSIGPPRTYGAILSVKY